jgi:1-deoxy-D-xylulose-5-phosphate reductoisomerase
MSKGLSILGSTGSIGQNCLKVVRCLPGRFHVVSLAAGRNLEVLAAQIREFRPQVAVVSLPSLIEPLRERLLAAGHDSPLRILAGREGQIEAVTLAEVDMLVSSAHATTGVVATYEAIKAGKQIGLANKETLVVAGQLVVAEARKRGVTILPIDSEHSAIHQCLRAGEHVEIRRLLLTGSGGPFLKTPLRDFDAITPDAALKHPVWRMGGRITIDSATMMNKGLEIIEAHWLFGLPAEKIDLVIHPQSIVHSMVEFQDGAVMAQMSVPDMRLPIQYVLTHPDRVSANGDFLGLDLLETRKLEFRKPDVRRFPCLRLGRQALASGGVMPCALNAADEVAVEAFLANRLKFSRIPSVIEEVMQQTPNVQPSSLEEVLEHDREARRRAEEVVAKVH